jgi:energy-coupling factor transporter transmembrane protein EcfT
MVKFMTIGLFTAIMIAVLTVLDAQYEAIRDGKLPFRQLLIVYGVIWSLFGGIAGCVEQWLDSHE